nr:hypothetical protein Iba_chr04bCG9610 [Ipomoea batatas]
MAAPLSIPGAGEGDDEGDNTHTNYIKVSSDDDSVQVEMVSTYRAGVLIEVRVVGGWVGNFRTMTSIGSSGLVLKKTKREKMREVPSRAAEMGKENAAPSGGHGTGAKSCAGSGKSCAEAQNAAAANTASTKALITLTCAICEGKILLRFQGL